MQYQLQILSTVLGWGYVALWSVSFYPSLLTTHRLKSIEGVSPDFLVLNMVGYVAYTVSTTALYSVPSLRVMYAALYGTLPLVRLNDVVFCLHGLILTALSAYQFSLYAPRGKDSSGVTLRLSPMAQYIITGVGSVTVVLLTAAISAGGTAWLTLLSVLGIMKTSMSTLKYIPQVRHNWRRHSTRGWSIGATWLDFGGAALCLGQLCTDAVIAGADLRAVLTVKFALSCVTVVFDLIFLVQHYILYGDVTSQDADEAIELAYAEVME